MILPARELLLVEREKILDYLLNLDHRYGASKARFFGSFGFRRDAWEVLRDALCEHGRRWEVKKMTETGFGPRYEVHGELETPDGPDHPSALFGSWTRTRQRHGLSLRILRRHHD